MNEQNNVPRVLDPFESTFGIPPAQIGNCVIVSLALSRAIGFVLALLLCLFLLLIMYTIHRNHPNALRAWLRAKPRGFRDGCYERRSVRYY